MNFPPCLQPQATTDLLSDFVFLPFLEFQINAMIQHIVLAFSFFFHFLFLVSNFEINLFQSYFHIIHINFLAVPPESYITNDLSIH